MDANNKKERNGERNRTNHGIDELALLNSHWMCSEMRAVLC